MTEFILSSEEASQILGIGKTRLSQLTTAGYFSTEKRRVGGRQRVFYHPQEIEHYRLYHEPQIQPKTQILLESEIPLEKEEEYQVLPPLQKEEELYTNNIPLQNSNQNFHFNTPLSSALEKEQEEKLQKTLALILKKLHLLESQNQKIQNQIAHLQKDLFFLSQEKSSPKIKKEKALEASSLEKTHLPLKTKGKKISY